MKDHAYRLFAMLRDCGRALGERLRWPQRHGESQVPFRCNICGRQNSVAAGQLTREEVTCRCGSSVRLRALVKVLSDELFGQSYTIPAMPARRDLVGIDMSGATTYAERLGSKLGYTNTFLHKAPRLDITNPDDHWHASCDFVISSDVFEHVAPPVRRAFENTFRLLKPGGVFVLTVPYAKTGTTVEHFPELHDYRIDDNNGRRVLFNTTPDGRNQTFSDLIFHGGDGETLEMRVFSESGVLDELRHAGFTDIRIHPQPCQEHGILWPHDWSLPMSARRPAAAA